MRIAYPMRVDAIDKPGGDLVQVLRYIDAGKKAGKDGYPLFEGTLITDLRADLSSFDLIHLTNIDRPVDTYRSFLCAKATRKPILLSPIHHSYTEIERYESVGRSGIVGSISGLFGFRTLEYLRSLARCRRYSQLVFPTLNMMLGDIRESQRLVLAGSDRILVLTEKEKGDLTRDIGEIPEGKCICIRNGLEATTSGSDSAPSRDIDACIVGRIEARKNQITVLGVLKRLGISGIFVGTENPYHRSYCRQFKKMLIGSGSRYLGGLSHEETLRLMKRARVHISASWFEVLSLVDLEAYCAGCGIVASESGGTREILGDRAEYIYPDSEESIHKGISRMLERVSRTKSRSTEEKRAELIAETWDQIGNRLASIYRECVGNSGHLSSWGGEE